jgi:peptidyl-prolyl cis-trans isomerase SurA
MKYLNNFILFFSFLFFCHLAQAEMINKIVAKVNHEIITQDDLENYRAIKKKSGAKNLSNQILLDELIDELILQREVEKSEIEVPDDQITKIVEGEIARSGKSTTKFQKDLQDDGITLDQYRQRIKSKIQRDRFIQETIYPKVNILDYDAEEYFNRNPYEFMGFEKVRFYEILLTRETMPEDRNPLEFATEISDKLRRNYSARNLAKKYSKGAFSSQGGDSKLIPTSQLREDILNSLYKLKKGEVSDPIPTKVGILILKLIDHRGERIRKFDSVKNEVKQKLFQVKVKEELDDYLTRARSKHYVEILI